MKYTEIDQNRIIISQKKLQSWSVTSDGQTDRQTDGQTEIHTFFIWYPRVGREHNSPSGKNVEFPEDFENVKFIHRKSKCLVLQWENEIIF